MANHAAIFVEYDDGRPFSVVTEDGDDFDFDYCKRDDQIYYHRSGLGPPRTRIEAPQFAFPEASIESITIWVREGAVLVDEQGEPVVDHAARGYKLLQEFPGDPFDRDDVIECETVYCKTCDDRLPDDRDSPCEHIWYCDVCRAIGGAVDGATCKHVTRDEVLV